MIGPGSVVSLERSIYFIKPENYRWALDVVMVSRLENSVLYFSKSARHPILVMFA